ncbi:hypothetical protein M1B34_28150 [Pseudomonas sp. MAFF 302030]|uniref:Uncharacterized protein n=1 Tax=Pseudomonas morbosilactucae TaxID=2938197 RepID=A0A9X1Z0J4_9PSED|nr:hypothetical protein [Pseudomonas morbosilactucae]MCK9801436.1 hypothetical protein [Pseudomonas morbosilactucae]
MSNWFEDNPIKSVISHTCLVGAAIWAVSYFILDENKVNVYKAASEQYKAKVSVLESEVSSLKSENDRYRSWLLQDPKSFPALESKIKSLEVALEEENKTPKVKAEDNVDALLYELSKGFSKGESFTDPKTKAVIGVSTLTPDNTANGVVVLPGGDRIELAGAKPGTTWSFNKGGKKYNLTLDSVNWLNNSVKASVSEVSE